MSVFTQSIGSMARIYLGLHRIGGAVISKESVIDWMGTKVQSFTVTEGVGVFLTNPEPVLVLHIAGSSKETVYAWAEELRLHFEQDGVGVEWQGHYERVTLSPAARMGKDQKMLSRFNRELATGKEVEDMEPDLQTWWRQRYR